MKKVLSLLLLAAFCLTAFASCGGKDDTVIKIGGTGPLTGGAAIYGIAAQRGAQIAVEEINALGGLQFELKYEDDAHDAEKAVSAYNALVDWGMDISLGSVTSAPAKATSALNYKDHIFALTPSASATAVTEGKDNVFQMCFNDPNQGTASADYIKANYADKKIAIIYQSDIDYSIGIRDTFKARANAVGLNIVYETSFLTTDTDFSTQVAAAQTEGAELIFLPIYYTPASMILKTASDKSYSTLFFGVDGMDGILTMAGFDTELAEGVMLLTPFSADATDAKTVAFVNTYKEKYNEVPNQFAADAYDAVYAIYKACTDKGITASMSASEMNTLLISAFTTMSFDGLTGNSVTWSTDGKVSKTPKGMVIQDGEYVGLD